MSRSAAELLALAEKLTAPPILQRSSYENFMPFAEKLARAGWRGRAITRQLLELGEIKEAQFKNVEESIYRMIRKLKAHDRNFPQSKP